MVFLLTEIFFPILWYPIIICCNIYIYLQKLIDTNFVHTCILKCFFKVKLPILYLWYFDTYHIFFYIYVNLYTDIILVILIICLFPRHVKYDQIYSVFFATLEFSYMFFNYTFVDMVHSKLWIYMHGYCNYRYIIWYFIKNDRCSYISVYLHVIQSFFFKKWWPSNLCAYLIYYKMWLSLIVEAYVSFHLSTS